MSVDASGVVSFLTRLVRECSVVDEERGTNERGAAELVAREMGRLGWHPDVIEVAPGRPNVVAIIEGGLPGPTLLFEGHTDVVTEGDAGTWSHPPFAAEVIDGELFGRGAADMKAGLAAMLYGAAAFASTQPFPGRIVVAALIDEEGLMLGAKHFARTELARGVDAAIVCEPEGGEVCTSQKGAVRLAIEVSGVMAHGAMPDRGRNPIAPIAEVIRRLGLLQDGLQQRYGTHPRLGLPFVTPTVVQAGAIAQLNVIPATALLGVDVRTTPGIDHEALIARVRRDCDVIGSETDTSISVNVIDDRPATEFDQNEPIVVAVTDAHRQITGEQPQLGGVPGTTDGTILWRDARIPFVTYGPGGKWIAHQADEHVELAEVVRYAEVYATAAHNFLVDRA